MKKYRSLRSIRNRIQRLRTRRQPVKWLDICEQLDILTEDGRPDYGLASDIAFKVVQFHCEELPYYPSPEVAERLRVRPICLECRRPIRAVTDSNNRRPIEEHELWWRRLDRDTRNTFIFQLYQKYGNNVGAPPTQENP